MTQDYILPIFPTLILYENGLSVNKFICLKALKEMHTYKDVLGNGGIAPSIPNPGIRRR